MGTANFEDFYEVPNLNFDISKLRNDLDKVLKAKKFNSPGVTHFGAIPLNQIPMIEVLSKVIILEENIGQLLMKLEKKFLEMLILMSQNILN